MGIMDGFDRLRGTEDLPPDPPRGGVWPRWLIAAVVIALAIILIVGVANS